MRQFQAPQMRVSKNKEHYTFVVILTLSALDLFHEIRMFPLKCMQGH